MWIANGSFILLSKPLLAGIAFIVLQNTEGLGEYRDWLPGNTARGGSSGVEGRISRLSIKLTG